MLQRLYDRPEGIFAVSMAIWSAEMREHDERFRVVAEKLLESGYGG